MTSLDPIADTLLMHAGFVQRLARSLAGRDGDDLAQETFAAALSAGPSPVRNVPAWLASVVANIWRNTIRGAARSRRREATASPADNPTVDEILVREEVRRQVVAAVVDLPERLRVVVLLRYYEGLDSFAISDRLALPASTVRDRLQDAHVHLRRRLDKVNGDQRAAWALPLACWSSGRGLAVASVMLRSAWVVRAIAALAVILMAWISLQLWSPAQGGPPTPPVAPIEVAAARNGGDRAPPEPLADRQLATASASAAEVRGPEDLWGRVVAAVDGTAVSGAEVVLEHRDADEFTSLDLEYSQRAEVIGTTHSDPDGWFAFRVQRAWQHRLAVRASGYAPLVMLQCTGGSEVVVRMTRPAEVEGVVRSKEDGAALGDVLVEVRARAGWSWDSASTRTAFDGTFALAGLPPLPSYVIVRPAGLRPPEWKLVSPEPGQSVHLEIAVERGRTLRGIVRDEGTKQPIGDARIGTDWTLGDAVRTGADGSFELRSLDDRVEMHVRADGYAPLARDLAVLDGGRPLELDLSRGSTVLGRVLDDAGRPVPGTFVAAAADQWMKQGGHTHWLTGKVADDGHFRIEGIAATWRWQLFVRAPRMGTLVLLLPSEPLSSGTVDVGDIVLGPQAILEGRLVEEDGNPIAGAEVILMGHGADTGRLLRPGTRVAGSSPHIVWHFDNRRTRTTGDGTFRFAGLSSGSYGLHAQMDGDDWDAKGGPFAVRDAEVVTVPDVVVAKGLAIEGVVRIPGVREVPPDQKLVVTAYREGSGGRNTRVAHDGTFRIERLDAGEYVLFALDVPEGLALVPRHGVAAGTKGLEITLVPAAEFSGRVVDHDGKPVQRATVHFFPEGVGYARNAHTDADGRFRLPVAPGVRGNLSAQHPDSMWRQVQMTDVVAPMTDLELRLSQ